MMFDSYQDMFKKAAIMKRNMLAKGLVRAKAKCPYCKGYWHATLNGPHKHMWMKCDGDCGKGFMS